MPMTSAASSSRLIAANARPIREAAVRAARIATSDGQHRHQRQRGHERHPAEALGRAGGTEVEEEYTNDLAEGHGEQDQVDAAHPQGRQAHQRADQPGRSGGQRRTPAATASRAWP